MAADGIERETAGNARRRADDRLQRRKRALPVGLAERHEADGRGNQIGGHRMEKGVHGGRLGDAMGGGGGANSNVTKATRRSEKKYAVQR